MLHLANHTRFSAGNTGPITQNDLSDAFIKAAGFSPTDESSIMLQRLPSLGRINADSPDRQFLDSFILNGLRAESIIQLSKSWDPAVLSADTHYPADQSVWHGSVLRSSGRYRPGSLLGWKNLPDKLRTFNEGVAKVGPAMVTTAASVGFGGAVLACTGAQTILETIASLPVNPTISLSLAASFAGILTGNGGGGADVAMNILSGQYLAMGITAQEILHRVVALRAAGFSCLPTMAC